MWVWLNEFVGVAVQSESPSRFATSCSMAVEESVKRAIRKGDLQSLSADRLQELGVEIDGGIGRDDYTILHWACHYRKAEVSKKKERHCSLLLRQFQGCSFSSIHFGRFFSMPWSWVLALPGQPDRGGLLHTSVLSEGVQYAYRYMWSSLAEFKKTEWSSLSLCVCVDCLQCWY